MAISNMIYFSTIDGKVLSKEEALQNNVNSSAIHEEKALIENGYVTNFQELIKKMEESIQKAKMLDESYLEINRMQGKEVTTEPASVITLSYGDSEVDKLYRKSKMERTIKTARERKTYQLEKEEHQKRKNNFIREVKIGVAIIALSLGISHAPHAVEAYKTITTEKDSHALIEAMLDDPDVPGNYVSENAHRTDDNLNWWYDWDGIANSINELDEGLRDLALYDMETRMGPFAYGNADEVCKRVFGKDINAHAVEDLHLEDADAWRKKCKQDLVLQNGYIHEQANIQDNPEEEISKGGM